MSTPAPYGYLRPRHGGFGWVMLISLALHGGLIGAYALAASQRRPTIDLSDRAINTKLVKLGTKRDPKLLPRKVAAPAPKPEEKQLAVEEPKVEEKREEKKLEALQKIQDQAEREKAREEALKRIAERVGEDEEQGDPEGSPYGTETQAQRMSLAQQYYARLHDRIHEFYTVPSIISQAERRRLVAVVIIFVAPDGAILKHSIEQASGNDAFDQALEAAIVRSSPLPAPPEFLRDTVRDGVALRFRP